MTDWTPAELEQLAELLAEKVAARMPVHVCNFTPDEVAAIKSQVHFTQSAKATFFATAVGAFTLGVLALIGWGIIHWIKRELFRQ